MFYYDNNNIPSKLFRYSEAKYAYKSLLLGEFRFCLADDYKNREGDNARLDDEQVKKHTSQSEDNFFIPQSTGQLCKPIDGKFNYQKKLRDYFISCFSTQLDKNLFQEFSADSCLVIHNVEEFIERVCARCESMFPDWAGKAAPVIYDGKGFHDDPFFYKPASFNQQKEWRFACMSPPKAHEYNKDHFFDRIGNIEKIAEIVCRPVK